VTGRGPDRRHEPLPPGTRRNAPECSRPPADSDSREQVVTSLEPLTPQSATQNALQTHYKPSLTAAASVGRRPRARRGHRPPTRTRTRPTRISDSDKTDSDRTTRRSDGDKSTRISDSDRARSGLRPSGPRHRPRRRRRGGRRRRRRRRGRGPGGGGGQWTRA
jgi:hypothetical protein